MYPSKVYVIQANSRCWYLQARIHRSSGLGPTVSVRGSLFTRPSSGELTKWESQPHSKYIYLSDNYRKGSPDMCNSGTSVTPSMVRWALFSLQEGLAINGLKNKSQGGGDFTNLKKNQIAFMDIKYHEGSFTFFSHERRIFKCRKFKVNLIQNSSIF